MLNNIWERVVFIERAFTQSFAVHIHVSLRCLRNKGLVFLRCAIVSVHQVRQSVLVTFRKSPAPFVTVANPTFCGLVLEQYFQTGLGRLDTSQDIQTLRVNSQKEQFNEPGAIYGRRHYCVTCSSPLSNTV